MKKQIQVLLFSIAILATSTRSGAQTLIHYWNFNTFNAVYYTPNIPPIDADFSVIDTSKARIYYEEMAGVSDSFSTYEDFYPTVATDSDNVNLQMGDTAGNALRVRNPVDSMYLVFYIPTTNFKNIVLKYASQSSSTSHGPLHQDFSYSLDSGATWISSGSGLSEFSDSAWLYFHLTSVTFNDTAANNNPKLVFRITFSGNTTGTSGNNRFDNVTVQGDNISGSSSSVAQVTTLVPVYAVYPNPTSGILNVTSDLDEAKFVTILNAAGQQLYATTASGKSFSIDVAALATGNYYIQMLGKVSGNNKTIEFIKK
jgi:hypothetical protein